NPAGADGLVHGNPKQVGIQAIGALSGWVLAIVGTFAILKVVSLVTSLRVTPEQEINGLDLAEHGEVAYNLLSPGMTSSSAHGLTHETYSGPVAAAEGLGSQT
ncbi:MAG: hypothetical protein ACREDR_31700, partial [Blastocatellia bacterium]